MIFEDEALAYAIEDMARTPHLKRCIEKQLTIDNKKIAELAAIDEDAKLSNIVYGWSEPDTNDSIEYVLTPETNLLEAFQ
tara:strand:+ start:160 stop:399 length:240 start_codon:yes stop_codon:yes gene_type:complete